ncbi:hypothetical protein [Pseudomonas aeruginosa]
MDVPAWRIDAASAAAVIDRAQGTQDTACPGL